MTSAFLGDDFGSFNLGLGGGGNASSPVSSRDHRGAASSPAMQLHHQQHSQGHQSQISSVLHHDSSHVGINMGDGSSGGSSSGGASSYRSSMALSPNYHHSHAAPPQSYAPQDLRRSPLSATAHSPYGSGAGRGAGALSPLPFHSPQGSMHSPQGSSSHEAPDLRMASVYASPRLLHASAGGVVSGHQGAASTGMVGSPSSLQQQQQAQANLARSYSMGHAHQHTHTHAQPPLSAYQHSPSSYRNSMLPTLSTTPASSHDAAAYAGNSPYSAPGAGSMPAAPPPAASRHAAYAPREREASNSSTNANMRSRQSSYSEGTSRQAQAHMNAHPPPLPASLLGVGLVGPSTSSSNSSPSSSFASSSGPRAPASPYQSLPSSARGAPPSPYQTVGSGPASPYQAIGGGASSPYQTVAAPASASEQRPASYYDAPSYGSRSHNGGGGASGSSIPGSQRASRNSSPSRMRNARQQLAADATAPIPGGHATFETHDAHSELGDGLPYAYSSRQAPAPAAYHSQGGSSGGTHPPPPPPTARRGSTHQAQTPTSAASYDHSRTGMISLTGSGYHPADAPSYGVGSHSRRTSGYGEPSSSSSTQQRNSGFVERARAVPPSRTIVEGFRRVRDVGDLRPRTDDALNGKGRRADPSGGHVSPLKALTAYLHHTYHLVNPVFFYELSFNPRRVLTKPSRPVHNDGHDNEEWDYILYVNDWLGAEEGNRYLILDTLGQGTFGQVVKCQNMKTHEIVAVKVIKNKPAYFNQSMMEVEVLGRLNSDWDPDDEHHILRMRETFIHASHLCLVFELLSSNLYELIKQNSFRGLSTSLVRVFTAQLLDALTVLKIAKLIHCDLKPENILLKTLQRPSIKLVDFGSACLERQTVYTYIQSRFYRSPEVLLGLPYTAMIDMWSLGCIAVELFLGLPLFPGTSEYNQVCRIVEMLGNPPTYMLEQGKQTAEFFNIVVDSLGRKSYHLKSLEQYSIEHKVKEQPTKRYFQHTKLEDIIDNYYLQPKGRKAIDTSKEMANRTSFTDFVKGLLNMDPQERWTPQQAMLHPFITNEPFLGPYHPPPSDDGSGGPSSRKAIAAAAAADAAKHPYGGLQTTPARSGGRAYHDAAAYNQHLAQQQSYNSVAATARTNTMQNNPYAPARDAAGSAGPSRATTSGAGQAVGSSSGSSAGAAYNSYPSTRQRSNTLTRTDGGPPSAASLSLVTGGIGTGLPSHVVQTPSDSAGRQRMGSARGAVSAGGAGSSGGYQQLDLLQEHAELGTPGRWGSWGLGSPAGGVAGPSSAGPSYTQTQQGGGGAPGFSVVVDRQDGGGGGVGVGGLMSPSSPLGRVGSYASPTGNVRYSTGGLASLQQGHQHAHATGSTSSNAHAHATPLDLYDSGLSQLMPALQPTQYAGAGGSGGGGTLTTAQQQQRLSMMGGYPTNLNSASQQGSQGQDRRHSAMPLGGQGQGRGY